MTYQITYISSSTNKPVQSMKVGAKDLEAAKLKGRNYHQKHLRYVPKVTMLVSEVA